MQRWFTPHRRKQFSIIMLSVFLISLVQGVGFRPLSRVARAEEPGPAESRQNPWPDVPDQLVLEPFPAGYPAKGPDGADPGIISSTQAQTSLTFKLPDAWASTADYKEADVAYDVAAAVTPDSKATIHTEKVAPGGTPSYSWTGDAYKDGLYLWSYQATPVKADCPPPPEGATEPPPECAPNFSDTPATGGPFPVIIDRLAPSVLGLQSFRDGWLGAEVQDQVSGVKRVEVSMFAKGSEGLAKIDLPPIELADHPRHAVVRVNLAEPTVIDWMVRLVVTDFAGNQTVETLPLGPSMRTPQLGTGAPWLSASAVIGGQPQSVNMVTGNGFLTQDEVALPVQTMDLNISRFYNHQNRQQGLLGWGWRLSIEADLRVWPGGVATWQDPSGTIYTFHLSGGEARPLVDGVPRAWPRLSGDGQSYRLRWADGTAIRFDGKGLARAFVDSIGTERLTYVRDQETGRLTQITTSVPGRRVELAYEDDLLTELTLFGDAGTVRHITFAYTNRNLTRAAGIDGQVAEFAYDGAHRLTAITNILQQPGGEQRSEVDWEYGAFNRVTAIRSLRNEQNPAAPDEQVQEFREISYLDDESGPVTQVKDPLGITRYRPDGMGRPMRTARFLRNDSNGNPVWAVDQFQYQGHRLTSYTDPDARLTTYIYDGQESLTDVTFPDRATRTHFTYTYAADDQVQHVETRQYLTEGGVEKQLSVTSAGFDKGRLAFTVGPKGSEFDTTAYTYGDDGLLASVRDPYGYVTHYDYNAQGLPSRVTDWPARTGEGSPTDPGAEWTELTYDGLGRLLKSTTKLTATENSVTEYTYDPATGDPTVTQHQPPTALGVDARDLRTQVQTLRSYLPGTRPVQVTRESLGAARAGDPGKAVTAYRYNTAGMPVAQILPADTVTFRYDAMGLLRTQAQHGAVATLEYDGAGRLIREENARGGAITYAYDLAGQLLGRAAFGQGESEPTETVAYRYDPLGRVTAVISPAYGTTTVTRSFSDKGYGIKTTVEQADPVTGAKRTRESEEQYMWSGEPLMRRTGTDYRFYHYTFTDPEVEVAFKRPSEGATGTSFTEEQLQLDKLLTYQFDGRGRVTAEIQGAAGQTPPAPASTYTYDGLNRVVSEVVPEGERKHEVTYTHDVDGNLVSTASDAGTGSFAYSTVGSPLWQKGSWTTDSGQESSTLTYRYDDRHRPTGTRSLDKNGSVTAQTDIAYDDAGNPATVTQTGGGATASLYGLSFDDAFGMTGLKLGNEQWGINYDSFGRPTSILPPGATEPVDLRMQPAGGILGQSQTTPAMRAVASISSTSESKPLGEKYSSVYGGYLFTRRELDGTESQVVIDGSGNVTAVVDNRGQVTKYAYDDNGRLATRTDARGQTTSYTYDAVGRILTETDAKRNLTRYKYEENGLKVTRTDPLGNTEVTRTTLLGKPLSVTDGNGHTTSYEYDAAGNLKQVVAPTGDTTTFEYDAYGGLTRQTDARGGVTTYTRDGAGRVVAITDPEGHQEQVEYNAWGKVAKYTDKQGQSTTYAYGDSGRLNGATDPLKNTTTYERDARGQVISKTIDKHVTSYKYNERGWLVHVEEPGDNGPKVTDYQYDEVGRLANQRTAQSDGQVNTVAYTYDEIGRMVEENFGAGLWHRYTYDSNSNPLTRTSSNGLTTTYQYDPLNRLSRQDNGDGTWTAYTYDATGNKLTESNQTGTTTYTYTPDNRLETETTPDGRVTQYVYDPNGNIIHTIKDGTEQDASYDKNNRVTEITDGLGYKYSYEYDNDGYVTAVHLPNGLTTHTTYDERHNIKRQWTDGAAGSVVSQGDYGYGIRPYVTNSAEDGRNFSFRYDGRGQMQQATNERGDVIRYYYDGAGNMIRREAVIGGAATDYGESITVDELMATIMQQLKASGGTEEEEEDAGDVALMPGAKLAWGDHRIADVWPAMVAAAGGNGKGKGQDNPGGGNGNPGGNGKGHVSDGEHGKGNANGKGGPKPKGEKPSLKGCQALEHGKGKKVGLYRRCADELGLKTGLEQNLLSIIDNLVNGEYYLPPGDKDGLFALVREVAEGYTIVGTTYTYNEKNQLLTRYNLVRDEEHQYAYDLRGNMTNNGRSQFTWDEDGRLIQTLFPDGEGVRYSYDALGRRTTKTDFNAQNRGLHVTQYEYEGNSWNVVRERNKDGAVTAGYTYDLQGRPLTITYGGETFWYVYNAHGDVVSLTDGTGTIKARYEYDEWGRVEAMYDETGRVREGYGTIGDIGTGPTRPVIGSPVPSSGKSKKSDGAPQPATLETTGEQPPTVEEQGELQVQGVIADPSDLVKANPYRYGGYRYDRDTQYYYLQARYYDGRLARFLTPDSRMGDVSSPLTLNRYIYVVNNPVNHLDPTGHMQMAMYTADGGGGGVEPEQALADLEREAAENYVRSWGFNKDAIRYYGVDFLNLAIASKRLSMSTVIAANSRAKTGVLLGATFSLANAQNDPLYRMLMGLGPVVEAKAAAVCKAVEDKRPPKWVRVTTGVVEGIFGGLEAVGGAVGGVATCAESVGLGCVAGWYVVVDGASRFGSGFSDAWYELTDQRDKVDKNNVLRNAYVAISPKYGGLAYEAVGFGANLGNAWVIQRQLAAMATTLPAPKITAPPKVNAAPQVQGPARGSAAAAEMAAEFQERPLYMDAAITRYASEATHNPNSGLVVLGKFSDPAWPSYVKEAVRLRATYFSLAEWNAAQDLLGKENMWQINEQFLKDQTALEKTFLLVADPESATGYFAKEVQFLKDAGYVIKPDNGFWQAVKGR